ncbi:MAG: hypothetical protein IKY12_03945 [Clostridia bacterium]|nr:hypothetical protein [Clostridia bacterium]
MLENYNSAMNKIKADPAFRAQLLQKLENSTEIKVVNKKPANLFKTIKLAASVAACLFVVCCVGVFFNNPPKNTVHNAVTNSKNPQYTNVVYIDFDGFEKYGVKVEPKAIYLTKNMSQNYSLTRMINETYNDVIIYDGMLYSVNGFEPSENLDLNIYVDDHEILNLDTERLSQYYEGEDVYLTVTVTE